MKKGIKVDQPRIVERIASADPVAEYTSAFERYRGDIEFAPSVAD